jgi:hypothetical protein
MTWALIFVSVLAALISQFWTQLFGYSTPFIIELLVGPILWLIAFFAALYVSRDENRRRKLWFFAATGVAAFWQLAVAAVTLTIWKFRGFV